MKKLLLYADNATFVLQEPIASFQVVNNVLVQLGKVSGYKVNEAKSVLLELNITREA